jgi:hypothetical protein
VWALFLRGLINTGLLPQKWPKFNDRLFEDQVDSGTAPLDTPEGRKDAV